MRGSIKYQAQIAFNFANGIGSSKKESRENSERKGANGHNVSEKIHSLKSKDQFMQVTKAILQHQKDHFKISPDIQNITAEHLKSFINHKIEKGLKYDSISTYMSQFHKLSIAVQKIPDKRSNKVKEKQEPNYNLNDIKNIRATTKQEAISNTHTNRSYINPSAIQAHLSDKSLISFRLQNEMGLRVAAATRINAKQLKDNNRLQFKNKGGKLQTVKLDKSLYNDLKNSIQKNSGHYIKYQEYLKDFKAAVKMSGQKYFGTHGLRYSYAQSKFNELQKQGMTSLQAKQKVSNDLGHTRADITEHYLK